MEELMGLREMIGDSISPQEWGAIEAGFAYADASGNQNNRVNYGEMMDMITGMRDAINEMGGVEEVFNYIDSHPTSNDPEGNQDGNISGMEWESMVLSLC